MGDMKTIAKEEFRKLLDMRSPGTRLVVSERQFEPMDLTGWDLSNVDLSLCSMQHVILKNVNFQGSSVENALFDGTNLHGADFRGANMRMAAFRSCDLGACNICGADLYAAVLEGADLKGILSDETTRWFRLACPPTGPFLGYKKCVNDRLVQLLIPADAKRTSATMSSCRCNKAKVLTIKSFDYQENFEEAWSLVDENFVYRVGQWIEVLDFNEDRWYDSTTGIHFWMSREEAMAY